MMKNRQHQQKGKPHTKEKYQDAATSMEDAIADTVHNINVFWLKNSLIKILILSFMYTCIFMYFLQKYN